MPWTPLILDTFVFDEANLETPEAYGDLGGTQSLSQHDYPGGTRTHKSYGYFPAVQKWRAKFHGMDASDRAEGVKRILAAGREVKLQFANRAWLGRVAKFSPTARHSWLFEYELEFWPRIDQGSPGPTLPPVTDFGTVLALHILSIQGIIQYGLDPNLVGQVVAAEIGGPTGFMISQVQSVMSSAGGSISAITGAGQQQVFQSSLAAIAACQPYQTSTNPLWSSPAADIASRAQAIQNLMTVAQPPVASIQTINPNLFVLSAQYYGDATQWRTIANANGLADPQPIGSYNLTIPQQT
jgi:hypothetical protein